MISFPRFHSPESHIKDRSIVSRSDTESDVIHQRQIPIKNLSTNMARNVESYYKFLVHNCKVFQNQTISDTFMKRLSVSK